MNDEINKLMNDEYEWMINKWWMNDDQWIWIDELNDE